MTGMTLLVIGYGNAGRGDDGLGPAFAERIAEAGLAGCRTEIDYQLTPEHALQVAGADAVVFADAELGLGRPFRLERLKAERVGEIASHALAPGAVLALAELLYGATPDAWVLGIAGEDFGAVAEGLSDTAARNLELALSGFLGWHGAWRARSLADA
ncbi:MAG: hydrogenase maturation protease [Devosia sp.]|nr:hydrogenase maturation protease [Devosia sp.]